mmetsp:Transcript_12555/g.25962  ORF Transcript_12555/g.25962 Transcript_12555/m.25962 type:complete len:354 (-) Transcript_12555:196-1257(-)
MIMQPFFEQYVPADELPDSAEALSHLDVYWRRHDGITSPSILIGSIAHRWGGGFPKFLHARETSAKPQPKFERGKQIQFTTLGGERGTLSIPFALIFDIHCNGRPKWCGVHPVNSGEIAGVHQENDEGEDVTMTGIYPQSSKTLGDKTDPSTIHSMDHGHRPSKYLFSADADDTRTWRFNVSVVSPWSAETLIISSDIIPRDVVEYVSEMNGWDEKSGYEDVCMLKEQLEETVQDGQFDEGESDHIKRRREFLDSIPYPDTEKLMRCSNLAPVTILVPLEPLKGLDEDGNTKQFELVKAHACYWLDKKNPKKERLHVTLDYYFEDSLWTDMILNPRAVEARPSTSNTSSNARP